MNFDVYWYDNSQTNIVCSFKDLWTWYECREALQHIMYLQEEVPNRVNHVYDFAGSRLSAGKTIGNLRRLLNLSFAPAPKYIILVDKPLRMHILHNTVHRIFNGNVPDNLLLAESIDDACHLVKRKSNPPRFQPRRQEISTS